jgi:signal transduction histidine kinase
LPETARRARLLEALPLLLVALLAVGVMVVTLVILQRTTRLRAGIATGIEEIRTLSDTVEVAVARQAVALQAFAVDPDPAHRSEYQAARALEDEVMVRLDAAAQRGGPSTMTALSGAQLVLRSWHRTQDDFANGLIDAAAYRERLGAQVGRFQDVLGIMTELDMAATALASQRRSEIARLQQLGALLTALLALATVAAAGAAYRLRGGIRESARLLEIRAHEAEDAVRTRDEVLAIVSHDLRNALNAMTGAVGLAQEPDLPPERRSEQLALALRSARGMSRLIADLLDVTRMEAGKLSVEARPESVGELLAHAEGGYALEAERRGVVLVVSPPEEPVAVLADAGRITQVLGNLIGNALKFTPEGGTVLVDVRAATDRVTFIVSDTGPGIPEDHLPHIFDRFYQVRASGRAGAGLGLAIARGLVEAHGAALEVDSRPGEGTTFAFDLQRVSSRPAASA